MLATATADPTDAGAGKRQFGQVRPVGGVFRARYSVAGGGMVTRDWPTEDQAVGWLAWVCEHRCRRWPGKALQDMPKFVTPELLAELLGLSRGAVVQALKRGLSHEQADRYAMALGYHPGEVWGWDAWMAAALEVYPGDEVASDAA